MKTNFLIVLLLLVGIYLTKGHQWFNYKMYYWRRNLWRAFGRCHKCHAPLNYTGKGRGICSDPECRDKIV